jgi:tripartite ATP-independent transporter DctP family solute receptor
MKYPNRRQVLAGIGTAAILPIISRPAWSAPEFRMKLSLNTPANHPVTVRSKEAADQIAKDTGGRVQVDLFPNSQLGGDTDALSQLRSGAIEMQAISGGILANVIPGTNLYNVPFAFPNYDAVWKALDGDVGSHIVKLVEGAGLHCHSKLWDNGFRQCTTSSIPILKPEDLKNMKMRVAAAPLLTSVFRTLGAAITSITVAEVYMALQTRVVDAQENGLALIESLKLYEVQKHCSMTNHMWDGFVLITNGRAWKRLPPDLQQVVTKHFDTAIVNQRADLLELDKTLRTNLQGKGLVFHDPDTGPFKTALANGGFYKEWKGKFGDAAWRTLENYTGALA